MSYGRSPLYIWSDGDWLHFWGSPKPESEESGPVVSEMAINAFLFKVLLTGRRDELSGRLREGMSVWSGHTDSAWIASQTDDLLRQLMGDMVKEKETD